MKKAVLILVLAMLAVSVFGNIQSAIDTDPMSGDEVVTIVIYSDDAGSIFVTRITNGTLIEMFLFIPGVYLGDSDDRFIIKLDDEEPVYYGSTTSTDGTAKFLLFSDACLVIDDLINGYKMVTRVYDYNGTAYTDVFDISEFMGTYYKYFGDN